MSDRKHTAAQTRDGNAQWAAEVAARQRRYFKLGPTIAEFFRRCDLGAAEAWRRRRDRKHKRLVRVYFRLLTEAGARRSPYRRDLEISFGELSQAPAAHRLLLVLLTPALRNSMYLTHKESDVVRIDIDSSFKQLDEILRLDYAVRESKWVGTKGLIRRALWSLFVTGAAIAGTLALLAVMPPD